jgi:hypothetical protein
MVRRTAPLSVLTLTLLLGACSNKSEAPAAAADLPPASEQRVTTKAAPPEAERKFDFWQFVGPLVAGTYRGNCEDKPGAGATPGAVTVSADGKATAGALNLDFRNAQTMKLARKRHTNGDYGTHAVLTSADGNAKLWLNAESLKDGSAVSLTQGGSGPVCSGVEAINSLNGRPLYMALTALLEGSKQTIPCMDKANPLQKRDVEVNFAGSVVTVGDLKLDMQGAVDEGFAVEDSGKLLKMGFFLSDDRSLSVQYDTAGKITSLSSRKGREIVHSCDVKIWS